MVNLKVTCSLLVELGVKNLPFFKTWLRISILVILKKFSGYLKLIFLSNEREDNIKDCFQNQHVRFNYLNNLEDFEYLLEMYKRDKAEYAENNLGEKMVLDKLIVMDDVSGLADKSDEFPNFLTVSRKYAITCVYIFHTIYPSRQSWQMIMSQTWIFNFFLGSVQASAIFRLLSSFAIRLENDYVPHKKPFD